MTEDPTSAPTGGDRPDDDPEFDPAVAMLGRDDASAGLGMELLEVRPGYARIAMEIDDRMINGHGIAHGGYVFTLADTAFGTASNSGRPTTVAASADIDFLAPVRVGERLVAEAVERVHSGRSGITDVTVWRDGPEPVRVAEFRGRSRTVGERQRG